jgi:peptidoglycan/LPS O-acetylase OafA/YrhL
MPATRLAFIDGLRGLAILMVVVYHAYARWPQFVPYGSAYASLGRYGFLGVQLFFLISGFVILMTIEKTATLRAFLGKRWLRLFPAMLVCSLLIYASTSVFDARPEGDLHLQDLLPGLTFVQPKFLELATGLPVKSVDGVLWSIYVEVQFYILFGGLYYWRGRSVAMGALLALYVGWLACSLAHLALPTRVLFVLGAPHFAWFLAGALLFRNFSTGQLRHAAMGLAAIALGMLQFDPATAAAAAVVVLAFVLPVCTRYGRGLLSWRPLLVVGVASYPLYLLHQNITVASAAKIGAALPLGVLLPVVPTAVLIAVAWLIATRIEPSMRAWLTRPVARNLRWSAPASDQPPE